MMSMRMLLLVLLTLSASACAIQRAEVAARAQREMVGITKSSLLSCAGTPIRQERSEGLEFLTFAGGGEIVNTATITANTSSTEMNSRVGSVFDPVSSKVTTSTSSSSTSATARSQRRYCEATFVLKEGIVQKVSYQGRTGGALTKGEQCAFIVENCVK